MESRTEFKGWDFSIWEIVVLKARDLASGRTICQLKLTCPVKESQLGWELERKEGGAQTEGNLPMALANGKKD